MTGWMVASAFGAAVAMVIGVVWNWSTWLGGHIDLAWIRLRLAVQRAGGRQGRSL